MFKDRPILLTLAVLALATTLIMPNVISVLGPNPTETTPTESLSSSADGYMWTTTQVVSTESTDWSGRPSLAVSSDGTIHVAWVDFSDYGGSGTDHDVFYKRWVPGTGWTTTEVVSTESTYNSSDPSLALGPDGRVHIAWSDETDYSGAGTDWDIFHKNWLPSIGWTTTEVVSRQSTGHSEHPCLAAGSDGVLYLAWQDETDYSGSGTDVDIFYTSGIPGWGWMPAEVISTGSTIYSWDPSLAVGPDGTKHVAWTETDRGAPHEDDNIVYKKLISGSGWTSTEVVSTESTAIPGGSSLAVGSDGTAHVAWNELTDYGGSGFDHDIFYKRWVAGTGWTTTDVVSTESTGDSRSSSLAVGADGTVHVAWSDWTNYGSSNNQWDIFYKRWEPSTGWTTTEVVSTESTHQSVTPSLAVGSDGTIHVAWEDPSDYGGAGPSSDIFYKTCEKAPAYLVVRGLDNRIYYRMYVPSSDSWEGWNVVPTGTTCDTPAAAVYNGGLYMVVRGMDESSLWFGWVNLADGSFSEWTWIPGATPSPPSLIVGYGGLILVVRGTNDRICYNVWDGTSWGGWIALPGATNEGPAVVTVGYMPTYLNWLHMVVRGLGGGLWHGSVNLVSGSFGGWYPISGATPSRPVLVATRYSIFPGLVLAVRGLSNRIYYREYEGVGGWMDWNLLPGATSEGPAAAKLRNNLHIVVKGLSGDMYHGFLDLETEVWDDWDWISGGTLSAPTLTS